MALNQHHGKIRKLPLGASQQLVDAIMKHGEIRNISGCPVRLAMAPVVDGKHRVSLGHAMFGKIAVASGMFGIAVNEQDYGLGLFVRKPFLQVQFRSGGLGTARQRQRTVLTFQAIFLFIAIS